MKRIVCDTNIISGDKHLLDIRSFRKIPILTADRIIRYG